MPHAAATVTNGSTSPSPPPLVRSQPVLLNLTAIMNQPAEVDADKQTGKRAQKPMLTDAASRHRRHQGLRRQRPFVAKPRAAFLAEARQKSEQSMIKNTAPPPPSAVCPGQNRATLSGLAHTQSAPELTLVCKVCRSTSRASLPDMTAGSERRTSSNCSLIESDSSDSDSDTSASFSAAMRSASSSASGSCASLHVLRSDDDTASHATGSVPATAALDSAHFQSSSQSSLLPQVLQHTCSACSLNTSTTSTTSSSVCESPSPSFFASPKDSTSQQQPHTYHRARRQRRFVFDTCSTRPVTSTSGHAAATARLLSPLQAKQHDTAQREHEHHNTTASERQSADAVVIRRRHKRSGSTATHHRTHTHFTQSLV